MKNLNVSATAVAELKKSAIALPAEAKPKNDPSIIRAVKERLPEFSLILGSENKAIRFSQILINLVRNNPEFLQVDASNLLGCFVMAATMDLEPNTMLDECSIVVLNKKQQKVAVLWLGYKGLMKLAVNSGIVKDIEFEIVRKGDGFTAKKGMNPIFEHVPDYYTSKKDKPAQICWVGTHLMTGGYSYTCMNYDDAVEFGKKYSPSYNSDFSAWQNFEEEMVIKTVMKQHFSKKLPKSTSNESDKFSHLLNADGRYLSLPLSEPLSLENIQSTPILDSDDTPPPPEPTDTPQPQPKPTKKPVIITDPKPTKTTTLDPLAPPSN